MPSDLEGLESSTLPSDLVERAPRRCDCCMLAGAQHGRLLVVQLQGLAQVGQRGRLDAGLEQFL
jgi:hypothetical protein